MNPLVTEAIQTSRDLADAGHLSGSIEILSPHRGQLHVDLQIAEVCAAAVFFESADPAHVDAAVAEHRDHPRALDLLGLTRYYAAMTSGSRDFGPALTETLRASRMDHDSACWKADNRFHIGLIQQAIGSHDIAVAYLEEAAAASDCPRVRAFAARHLGMDAELRGDRELATRLLHESLEIRRHHRILTYLPFSLIACAELSDDMVEADAMLTEALVIARALGLKRPLAMSLFHHGRTRSDATELAEARTLAEQLGHIGLIDAIDALRA